MAGLPQAGLKGAKLKHDINQELNKHDQMLFDRALMTQPHPDVFDKEVDQGLHGFVGDKDYIKKKYRGVYGTNRDDAADERSRQHKNNNKPSLY